MIYIAIYIYVQVELWISCVLFVYAILTSSDSSSPVAWQKHGTRDMFKRSGAAHGILRLRDPPSGTFCCIYDMIYTIWRFWLNFTKKIILFDWCFIWFPDWKEALLISIFYSPGCANTAVVVSFGGYTSSDTAITSRRFVEQLPSRYTSDLLASDAISAGDPDSWTFVNVVRGVKDGYTYNF